MRSRFTDRPANRADIVPRSLRDLLATDPTRTANERRRRRQRKTATIRRAPR